jgi:hypothetical protein
LDNLKNKSVEVVLISIQNIKQLKQSYPNYFMDTAGFIENLERLFKIIEIEEQSNSINDDKIKEVTDAAFESILSKMIKSSDRSKKNNGIIKKRV